MIGRVFVFNLSATVVLSDPVRMTALIAVGDTYPNLAAAKAARTNPAAKTRLDADVAKLGKQAFGPVWARSAEPVGQELTPKKNRRANRRFESHGRKRPKDWATKGLLSLHD